MKKLYDKHSVLVRALCVLFVIATLFTAAEFFAPHVFAEMSAPLYELYCTTVAPINGNVTLCVDGTEIEYMTSIGTVENLLLTAGVTLGENDVLRPAPDARLEEGMRITVLRATSKIVVITEVMPHGVTMQPNEYIPRGTETVLSEGADGSRVMFYEVTMVDGVEIGRRVTGSRIEVLPINEVVEYGPGGVILTEDGRELQWSYKIDGNATAYTTEGFRKKHNALGNIARPGTIAVDPKVIPMRSKLYVCSRDGAKTTWDYGECTAEDTGGAVKGNIIDLFFSTLKECYSFGRRDCTIYILG